MLKLTPREDETSRNSQEKRMEFNLELPPEAAKYLSMQRLETQMLGGKIHYSTIGKLAYKVYEHIPFARILFKFYASNIEPRIRNEQIKSSYNSIMEREFRTIRNHLGDDLENIVSIGPGVAGLESMISHHCRTQGKTPPFMILIDKSEIDSDLRYGFSDKPAFYNSLILAKQTLVINKHPAERIETIEADTASSLSDSHNSKIDLVISLFAWGFHFPVNTYLGLVFLLLKPSGHLIIDVRKGTDGRAELEAVFGDTEVIHDDPKFERIFVTK